MFTSGTQLEEDLRAEGQRNVEIVEKDRRVIASLAGLGAGSAEECGHDARERRKGRASVYCESCAGAAYGAFRLGMDDG